MNIALQWNAINLSYRKESQVNLIDTMQIQRRKCDKKIMYTFTKVGQEARVYIIFWPHFISKESI